MLTNEQQQSLWETIFYSETRSAYYADVVSRYHRYQRYLSAGMLFLSSGSVVAFAIRDSATLAPNLHPWAPILVAASTALLSAVNFAAQFAKTANEASELCTKWASVGTEAEELWSDMYAETAPEQLKVLQRKSNDYGRSGHALPFSSKRWERRQIEMRKLFDSRLQISPSSL